MDDKLAQPAGDGFQPTAAPSETVWRRLEELLLCVALMFVVLGTYDRSFGDTANSRLATVYSLTHYGTWFIDRPVSEEPIRFEQGTIDKVMVGGHLLSSKPPILPLLMTGEYLVLHKLFGYDLDKGEDTDQLIRIMSMTFVGSAYMAALLFFLKTMRMFRVDPVTRLVLLFSLAFCTQLWGYGSNLNNHVPAAGLLVICVYLALGMGFGKQEPTARRFFAFGLTSGLVMTIDTPATIFAAAAGLFLLIKFPAKTLTWAALGAAIPIGTHAGIMWSLTGSPLPVQMHKEFYLYEASYWRQPRGIDALNEPKLSYLFQMTFGRTGLFSLFPVLLLGIASLIRGAVDRKMPMRGAVAVGGLAFAILTAYYAKSTNNYGGEAYGFRWYICAMPILLLMGVPVMSTVRRQWKWIFVSLMIGVSFYSAWECSKEPWGSNHEWTVRFLDRSYE